MRSPGHAVPRAVALAVLCASLAAAGCATGGSSDGDASEFAREGIYAGLYGIQAYEDFDTSGSGVSVGDSDFGIGGMVGYRATPNVAVEAVVEDVAGFEVDDGNVKADLDLLNFGLLGKYYLGTERFQPYLVAGAGLARADVNHYDYDDDGGFLRGGLGMDVYLSSNFAVFGEVAYNRMVGGVSDLHHIDLHLGLLFRF